MNTWKTHAFVISGMLIGILSGFGGIGMQSAQAGSLDPPTSAAPGGTPVPTMRTQDQLHPSWDREFRPEERWVSFVGGFGYLDRETGLLWRQPNITLRTQANAKKYCLNEQAPAGGRKGWRLPSVHELASLVEDSNQNPALPTGHPFDNVQNARYHTATNLPGSSINSWFVNFSDGNVDFLLQSDSFRAWCVRGGGPLSEY